MEEWDYVCARLCVCVDFTKVNEEGTGLTGENCKAVIFL